ncbi:MAG: hypothetical protein E6H64_00425 [Betaproteobacteria bacterium]|nr:MAG: hypothetical protein E6H64_00425 [Betaproteobacteria bacterium]
MAPSRNPLRNWITALCGAAALIACATVLADPPGRVARLAQINGTVSFSPAGEEEWVLAQPNRPLITGDRVWSDAGARAELQIGSASARLGSNTSATILNLDDRVVQIEVAQGTLNLRVRRVYADQVFEIDTPNLAFSIRRAGDYRIDVDPNGNATIVRVRSGEGEAWGEGAAYVVGAGQQYTFQGEGLRDYFVDSLPPPDEFDRWSLDRNRREDAAVSARYVSPDVVGYSDLDEYGTWRNVESYGNVWFPTTVAVGWVPYRTGHWGWIDPWGWNWIDEAPWGFAPFHYGRWAFVSSRWCWVPGPVAVRPIYAPALVAFIGGSGFSLSISTGPVTGIGWFPLGPGEVYQPAYAVSRTYFTNVNVSNTVVNTTVVNNFYNNTNVTNVVYRNREAPGAVTAVPTAAFTGAQPVARNVIPVPREVITREPVSHVVAVAPSHASVLAVGAAAAGAAAAVAVAKRPPPAALERRVVAKTAPPPPPPSFATKASLLAAQPGKPLEPEKLKGMAPARATETARFKVVAPTVTPQPLSSAKARAGRRRKVRRCRSRRRNVRCAKARVGRRKVPKCRSRREAQKQRSHRRQARVDRRREARKHRSHRRNARCVKARVGRRRKVRRCRNRRRNVRCAKARAGRRRKVRRCRSRRRNVRCAKARVGRRKARRCRNLHRKNARRERRRRRKLRRLRSLRRKNVRRGHRRRHKPRRCRSLHRKPCRRDHHRRRKLHRRRSLHRKNEARARTRRKRTRTRTRARKASNPRLPGYACGPRT